jgi:hypothetical protein
MTLRAYLRLAAARRALSARTDDPITSIAFGVGYTHLSRFACEYRERFGELSVGPVVPTTPPADARHSPRAQRIWRTVCPP